MSDPLFARISEQYPTLLSLTEVPHDFGDRYAEYEMAFSDRPSVGFHLKPDEYLDLVIAAPKTLPELLADEPYKARFVKRVVDIALTAIAAAE